MPLQDLTPRLRTRLSRMERAVGWFVALATLLLFTGFAYYIYNTAQRKGWFLERVQYITCVNSAAGIKEGDKVKMMGFDVGQVTLVEANAPGEYYNVTVKFIIFEPYYGYLWTDSDVRITATDFLGNRHLEVIKGRYGLPTIRADAKQEVIYGKLNQKYYKEQFQAEVKKFQERNPEADLETAQEQGLFALAEVYQKKPDIFYLSPELPWEGWLEPNESPALTDELEDMVKLAKASLPGILAITNQLNLTLSNATLLTDNLNRKITDIGPMLQNFETISTNLAHLTSDLTNGPGALGKLLLPPELSGQLLTTMTNADATLITLRTDVNNIVTNIVPSLMNLASVTSNLNQQVQSNTNILSEISTLIQGTHSMMEGLKTHWFLKSAFKADKKEAKQPKVKPVGKR